MIKDAIEARLSANAELAQLADRSRKMPRMRVGYRDGRACVEIVAEGPGRAEARRLIRMARDALHGQACRAGAKIATPRHIATDYGTDDGHIRAQAIFAIRIEAAPADATAEAESPAGDTAIPAEGESDPDSSDEADAPLR